MVTASARKNVPVTPVIEISGRNTTIGVTVEPISGTVISLQRAVNGLRARLPGIAVQHDILDHHDGIVDHQADAAARPPRVIKLKL